MSSCETRGGRLLLALVLIAALGSHAQAKGRDKAELQQQLSLLDADAGIVVSVQLSQFQELHRLAKRAFPADTATLDLAAMGALAVFGFNPFVSKAWQASGFDSDSRVLVQLPAPPRATPNSKNGTGDRLWRTRVVLKARDPKRARGTLSKLRLSTRSRLGNKDDEELGELLGIDKAGLAPAKRSLRAAGVVLVGRAAPLSGLLFVSQRRDMIVLDLLERTDESTVPWQWTVHKARLLAAVQRQPRTLTLAMTGAEVLSGHGLAVWSRPPLAARRSASQHGSCGALETLATRSLFSALSANATLGGEQVNVEARWHLPRKSPLLELLQVAPTPLLRPKQARLQALLHLSRVGLLRSLDRPAPAATWDGLWRHTSNCGRGSSLVTLAVAWPQLAGLFLDEVSALHPRSQEFVDALGGLALSISGPRDTPVLIGEAWVRAPGDVHAKHWLEKLFGKGRPGAGSVQWGKGKIRPYALSRDAGSIIGAGLGLGARKTALAAGAALRERRSAEGGARVLFEARAEPAALGAVIGRPLDPIWLLWKHAAAKITMEESNLLFTLRLNQI